LNKNDQIHFPGQGSQEEKIFTSRSESSVWLDNKKVHLSLATCAIKSGRARVPAEA